MEKNFDTETDIGEKFENFLREHRIPYGNPNRELITHVEMTTIKGSYKIIGTEYEDFIKLYLDFITSGNTIGMIEKHNGKRVGPVICDFDLRTKYSDRAYNATHIEGVIQIYNEVLTSLFDVDSTKLPAFVFEKDEPTKEFDKNGNFKGTYKDGFHIIWPYIPLLVEYRCLLYDLCLKKIKAAKIFDDIEALEPIDKICDSCVIFSNGMMMFGSAKEGRNPYYLSTVYNDDMTLQDLEDYSAQDILNIHLLRNYDDHASLVLKDEERFINEAYKCAKKYNYTELPFNLNLIVDDESTLNNDDNNDNNWDDNGDGVKQSTSKNKKSDELKALLKDKKQNYGKCTCCEELIKEPEKELNLNYIEKLTHCLSRKRCNDYKEWIRVGWALQNIWHGFLPVYITFSKKSSKFENGECEKIWKYAKDKGYGYNLPSLIKWAKTDNPDLYLDISKELLSDLIKKAKSNTHDDIANLIYEMYKTSYVCVDLTKNTWFEFQGHRWVSIQNGYTLNEKISSEICEKIINGTRNMMNGGMDVDNPDNDDYNKVMKSLTTTYNKLKDYNNKSTIIKACANKFYNPKFLNLLDSNGKLIGFENGVFDLRTMEFRDGIPEDYLTMTTGYNYIEFKKDDKLVREIENFFEKLHPEPECREFLLRFNAVCLDGGISLQQFFILPGTGGNGKSKLIELTKQSLGDYQKPLPVKILTGPTPDPQAATPALADKRGVRFVHSSEPGNNEILNISTMKLFTGGDDICTRQLYEKAVYFKPQFKMAFIMNDLVEIPSLDGGTWRRIIVLTFPTKFKKNPNPNKKYPNDTGFYEFEGDSKLDEKIPTWKEAYMWYLLKVILPRYYNDEAKKQGTGLKLPQRVIDDTNNYHKQCDKYYEYIHQFCEKVEEDKTESISTLYDLFKNWYRSAYNSKPPNQNEFKQYFINNEYKIIQNRYIAGIQLKENSEP